MGLIIGMVLGYLIGMPILLFLVHLAHKKQFIDKALNPKKGKKAKDPSKVPKPLLSVIRERMRFTIKDTRPARLGSKRELGIPNRILFLVLYLSGFAMFVIAGVAGVWMLLPLGIILFFVSIIFGTKASKDILETRQKKLDRMYNVGVQKLGLNASHGAPSEVVKVLEWEDMIKPQRVEYFVPDSFSSDAEPGFLLQFNQLFGGETAWVPANDKETGEPGWNYDQGKATFYAVPPLPTRADWDEHYVKAPGVAWSFFPLGLGVENGLELMNPKTGLIENVLGFDLSGIQGGIAKEAGLNMSPRITTSPMCFTGDTRILMADGTTKSFLELSQMKDTFAKVPTFIEDGSISTGYITKIQKTRENAWVWKVTLSNNSSILCTPDHPFRLINGEYVPANKLTPQMILSTYNGEEISIKSVEKSHKEDVYDAHVPHHENFFIEFPQIDTENNPQASTFVAVHNCLVAGGTGGGKAVSIKEKIKVLN